MLQKPIFEIAIGETGRDSRIICDGKDITPAVRGVTVECRAGALSEVTLRLVASSAVTTVKGAIEVLRVTVPADPACPLCGVSAALELSRGEQIPPTFGEEV